jgi:cyclic pyranopterin phosphate synthase
MRDPWGRRIRYLRVSVTDRCNLRCTYCTPVKEFRPLPAARILRFEEIVAVVRAAVGLGFDKFRLTGGEPLVRRDVVDLVAAVAAVPGVRDLAMTTNGVLLGEYAGKLAAAGLQRVNVSLDAIDRKRYAARTGGGEVGAVLAGIAAARRAGLVPVKLNCVVDRSPGEAGPREVAAFAAREGLAVRFIRRMDLERGTFHKVIGGAGGDCPRCDRLRLTSDGQIRPCLFSDLAFPVRALGPRAALVAAIAAKPAAGGACRREGMHRIGG